MKILYEDNHLLVVNKEFNILVQADKTGDKTLLDYYKEYIKKKYNKKGNVFLAPVHRLDRPAGGIIILARTSKAAARLSSQLRKKKIIKIYNAIIEGRLIKKSGYVNKEIKNGSKKYEEKLEYKVIEEKKNYSLVEINLITGKKHQIRRFFSEIKHPIAGDLRFGATKPLADKSIALLAKKVVFYHPVKKEKISLEIELPAKYPWSIFCNKNY